MIKILSNSRQNVQVIVLTSLLSLLSPPPSHADASGLIPQLQISLQRQNDFSIRITNFDPLWDYSAASDRGTTIVDRAGNISVVNLQSGDTAHVTVSTRRAGYFEGRASVNGGVMGSLFSNDASTINASNGSEVAVKSSPSPSAIADTVRSISYVRSYSGNYIFTIKSSDTENLIIKITLNKKSVLNKTVNLKSDREVKITVTQKLKGAITQIFNGDKLIRTLNVSK